MRYQVLLQTGAADDLAAIEAIIAADSPRNAARWYADMRRRISSLAAMPNRFPVAPESAEVGVTVRQMTTGNYRVLYVIEGAWVRVVHVRHAARRAGLG